MSLETLLEAARYVEQLEKKKARAAAAAAAAAAASATNAPPAPDHSHGVAPHSNHHNSAEPRGKSCMIVFIMYGSQLQIPIYIEFYIN